MEDIEVVVRGVDKANFLRLRPLYAICLIATAALWAAPKVSSAACATNIAGQTIDWALAVCEVRNETDDLLSPGVRACMETMAEKYRNGKVPWQNCRINSRFKREWCTYFVRNGREKSVAVCFMSTTATPKNLLMNIDE